jgi:hypothetical protein
MHRYHPLMRDDSQLPQVCQNHLLLERKFTASWFAKNQQVREMKGQHTYCRKFWRIGML